MGNNYKIVLQNGEELFGTCFGEPKKVIGEIIFHTSMAGYQEIATDPLYKGKIVVMTYPIIGTYGINDEDSESHSVKVAGMIVKEYNDQPSNFRTTKTLHELLEESVVPLVSGIDTRYLTRIIRDQKTKLAMICDASYSKEEALKELNEYVIPTNLVETVSTKKKWVSRTKNPKKLVVAIDLGTNLSTIKALNKYACNVVVMPFDASYEQIMNENPDGIFLTSGPGNPNDLQTTIEVVKKLIGRLPMMGVNLGHNILSVACGATVYKMEQGHYGANYPVKNIKTNKIEITCQGHSYAVCLESLKSTTLEATHFNVLNHTCEGVSDEKKFLFSVQYCPSLLAGPSDANHLFNKFTTMMEHFKEKK